MWLRATLSPAMARLPMRIWRWRARWRSSATGRLRKQRCVGQSPARRMTPTLTIGLAQVLSIVGRDDEALVAINRALALDTQPAFLLGRVRVLYQAARFTVAGEQARQLLALEPEDHHGRALLAASHMGDGQVGQARAVLAGFDREPMAVALRVLALAMQGERAAAVALRAHLATMPAAGRHARDSRPGRRRGRPRQRSTSSNGASRPSIRKWYGRPRIRSSTTSYAPPRLHALRVQMGLPGERKTTDRCGRSVGSGGRRYARCARPARRASRG